MRRFGFIRRHLVQNLVRRRRFGVNRRFGAFGVIRRFGAFGISASLGAPCDSAFWRIRRFWAFGVSAFPPLFPCTIDVNNNNNNNNNDNNRWSASQPTLFPCTIVYRVLLIMIMMMIIGDLLRSLLLPALELPPRHEGHPAEAENNSCKLFNKDK